MWCAISRWMISRTEDTGKKLPARVERHVRRCGACAGYARSVASLSARFQGERSAWLAGAPEIGAPDLTARDAAAPDKALSRRRSWPVLRPLPVAAAALAVLAGALVLFQVVLKEPAPSLQERADAMAVLKTIASAPKGLDSVIGETEAPLERERRVLEKSVSSAVEYLQARLNIRIERQAPRAKAS